MAQDRTDLHQWLGAHLISDDEADGVRFGVWAPAANHVSVVGDWTFWDPATEPLTRGDDGETWWATCPNARLGHRYKFAVTDHHGTTVEHADPIAFRRHPKVWGQVCEGPSREDGRRDEGESRVSERCLQGEE